MKIALFYHSLISDWNHGNAHFLRGIASELIARGNEVVVYEPQDAWSVVNLVREHGLEAIAAFHAAYPGLTSRRYDGGLDLDAALERVDLVLVHDWNDRALVARIGEHRKRHEYVLLFHDTHHRAVTAPAEIARYDLSGYDGVLAFGRVLRDLYLEYRWAREAWTWHEAADTRQFAPVHGMRREGDLVWIGNWVDDERATDLRTMLIEPVAALGLRARVHGVRYPEEAIGELADAGITYAGWLPNFEVPGVFARYGATIHVPRRPYVAALPGIPTIRVFEALASGIPLISAAWDDVEHLFTPGVDYLVARSGAEMQYQLAAVLSQPQLAAQLASAGRKTILARHTCAHRVDELLEIVREIS